MAKLFQFGTHGFVEHRLNSGKQFLGHRWPDDVLNTDAGIAIVADGFQFAFPVDGGGEIDGMGLFDFWKFFPRQSARQLLVVQAQILINAGVGWTLALTDGRTGGAAATTVDDPSRDVAFATGTGPAVRTLNVVLSPKQYIRLTTAAPVGVDDAFCRLCAVSVPVGSIGATAP